MAVPACVVMGVLMEADPDVVLLFAGVLSKDGFVPGGRCWHEGQGFPGIITARGLFARVCVLGIVKLGIDG